MRHALLLALAILACAADGPDIPADKAAFHIFVLMGQSNMAGTSVPIPVEYVEPASNVLVLRKDLVWRKADTPLDPAHGQGFSLGQSFARHYAALHPGVTVGLIQCARGGRGIKELAKGGKDRDGSPNYDDSMAKIRAAMQRGTIKGVLWHQGETDAGDAGYVAKLGTLVADLRSDLGIADLPFICGQLGQYATWTGRFNALIPAAATSIPHCGVAMSDGLLDLGDKVHFSGFGSEVLGARYLAQYLQLAEPALSGTFAPRLAAITTAMQERETGWTGVLNGDMSEGVSRPFAWDNRWTGTGRLEVTRDTAQSVSAPASLRLASVGGTTQALVGQSLRNVTGQRLRVSAKVRNDGIQRVELEIAGIGKNYKQNFKTTIASTGTTTGWADLSAEAIVPADTMRANLSIIAVGEGTAWVDDVAIERLGPAPAPAPAATPTGTELAKNGNMSAGEAQPTGWTNVWTASGKLAVARDTTEFKSAPAALRVDAVGGKVNGNASQALSGAAGKKVRITGWVKSDGKNVAVVALGSFDGSWKMLKFAFVYRNEGVGPLAWTPIDATLDVPAEAVQVVLSTGIDGEGSAWFDDLSAVVVEP
jgi:hypothetical protein